MNKKRISAGILALVLASSFAGCSSGSAPASSSAAPASSAASSQAASSEASAPADESSAGGYDGEVVELEFMNMNQAWKVPDYGSDPVTAKFIEETGVKFKCMAPQGDWEQIANVLLTSGDYPDMMHMDANATFDKYVAAGALLPLNQLSEEYNYPKIMNGEYIPEQVIRSRTSSDGNLYIIPNWYSEDGFGSVGTCVNVRHDLYEEMGSPAFTTIDDFYNYLVKIKEANPTTLDGAKMYPMAYKHDDRNYISYICNWWGSKIFQYNYFDEETQTVKFMLRNDTMRSGLKFLSKCLQEGLMDPEVLTFDSTQRTEAYTQGRYAVIMCEAWDLWTPNSALSQKDPNVYYFAVDPPQGTPGVQQWYGRLQKSGTSGTVVTKNCKNPEAAIRFINYFLSPEGETLNFYGIEGKTMEFVDGQPRLYPEAYEAKLADWDGVALRDGIRIWDFMNNQKYNWERTQESEARQKDRALATKYAFDGTTQTVMLIDPVSDEGILLSEIEANILSQLTQIIMEPDEAKIDTMIADLIAEYERKGITSLEEEWTRQYLERM